MKLSPLVLGFLFMGLGIFFTSLAVRNADETIWNTTSMIFMLLATMEFVYAIRFFIFRFKVKQLKKKQNKKT
ncbi:DUF4305 domain-containing protein [Bacillus taeanensis]|uniref:DUF4305 domain-containing protein n=1 Tax=Bacillus taeanensis TaxID=273032 RepID=A0A366XR14_9BACI|nr:DUF4305 domain-containing protein [Bacillus taeanensis]RBW67565.1 DUF4305 domain-containing protein [Bacillus taeanensis]